jgi:hypothetical protein
MRKALQLSFLNNFSNIHWNLDLLQQHRIFLWTQLIVPKVFNFTLLGLNLSFGTSFVFFYFVYQ